MSIAELPCEYCNRTSSTYCGPEATACVTWGGTIIAEPATMLTDFAVAAACFVASVLLSRQWRASKRRGDAQLCTALWSLGLGLLALSFAAAGAEHGFAVYTLCGKPQETCAFTSPLWLVSMTLAVVAVGTLVLAYAARDYRQGNFRAAQASAAVPLVVTPSYAVVLAAGYANESLLLQSFLAMVGFLVPLVLLLVGLCCRATAAAKTSGGDAAAVASQRSVARGLGLVVLAQLWQVPKVSPSRWFTANDVSHTIFFLAVPFLYSGAAAMRDGGAGEAGSEEDHGAIKSAVTRRHVGATQGETELTSAGPQGR